MSSLEQLKQTFFDECSEALQQIELGLPDIQEGAASEDTINAVFRSVHSVKGGAGIFGFEGLVSFAHVFETVLDSMRSGKLIATHDIVDTLLQANDVLSDLIAMSRSGEAIPADYGSECRAALEQILQKNSSGEQSEDDSSAALADFEGLDFVPVTMEQMGSDDEPSERDYRIVFRPHPELLKKANEPLYILRELRKLGTLDLEVETDRLPGLAELEVDRPYLGWTGNLRTAAKREQIDEVFEFVVGDCELEITSADPEPIAGPLADLPHEAAVHDAAESLPLAMEAPALVPAAAPVAQSVAPPPRSNGPAEHAGAPAPRSAQVEAGSERRHDDAGRIGKDRSRRQHGWRTRHCPGDARTGRPQSS